MDNATIQTPQAAVSCEIVEPKNTEFADLLRALPDAEFGAQAEHLLRYWAELACTCEIRRAPGSRGPSPAKVIAATATYLAVSDERRTS